MDESARLALSPSETKRLMDEHPGVQIIDVRTAESRRGRKVLPGAVHLDVKDQVTHGDASGLLAAGLDPNKPVVAICNSGGSCTISAAMLRENGFDAHFLEGGVNAWNEEGLPVDDVQSDGE